MTHVLHAFDFVEHFFFQGDFVSFRFRCDFGSSFSFVHLCMYKIWCSNALYFYIYSNNAILVWSSSLPFKYIDIRHFSRSSALFMLFTLSDLVYIILLTTTLCLLLYIFLFISSLCFCDGFFFICFAMCSCHEIARWPVVIN